VHDQVDPELERLLQERSRPAVVQAGRNAALPGQRAHGLHVEHPEQHRPRALHPYQAGLVAQGQGDGFRLEVEAEVVRDAEALEVAR
jgi:hypothetical protein